MSEEQVKVYAGWIKEDENGDNMYALYVGDAVLAEKVADDMDYLGQWLSVRYGISPHEVKNIGEIQMKVLERIEGITAKGRRFLEAGQRVRYEHAYSEITGYLWTNEDLIVGGHDLIAELRTYQGQFAVIEITYYNTPAVE